jgi:PAS domain S-box-containing protein
MTMGAEWTMNEDRDAGVGFDFERDLLCTADAKGYFTSLNGGWERLLGWTAEELRSRPFVDFVHPADREMTMARTAEVARDGPRVVHFENRYRARGGDWRWLRWSMRSDGEAWFAVAFDITERKETEHRLRGLLTDDHLVAYTQPILDQRRGEVAQEELLVRLRDSAHPDEVIQPAEFLPAVERCGLIGVVDRWMVAQGVELARRGRRAEVNLSARSIEDPELAAELETTISSSGVSAENLIFEITETAAIEHLDAARDFADRLIRLGCRFALDDFGTGFGSLTYLRRLPVGYLKIDTSFVSALATSHDDQAMVRGIVAIARELGVLTVAEGIEDDETMRLLTDYGVDYAQGYLIGPPVPLT